MSSLIPSSPLLSRMIPSPRKENWLLAFCPFLTILGSPHFKSLIRRLSKPYTQCTHSPLRVWRCHSPTAWQMPIQDPKTQTQGQSLQSHSQPTFHPTHGVTGSFFLVQKHFAHAFYCGFYNNRFTCLQSQRPQSRAQVLYILGTLAQRLTHHRGFVNRHILT